MFSGKIEDYILFEDKEIIVCRKPAGIAVQNARIGAMDLESSPKKLSGNARRWWEKDSISGSNPQAGSAGRRYSCIWEDT